MPETEQTENLSTFELQLVTFLDQHYQLTGQLMSVDKAFDEFGIPKHHYENALNKQIVKDALSERGVVFERYTDEWTAKSLTPIQLLVANAVLDLTDTRTIKKKVQDLGVATVTYNSWMKDPVFKSYLQERAEQLLNDGAHDAHMALLDKVRSGDVKAIEFFYEITGRYTRASARAGSVDAMGLITKIIEIIDEEVDDPATINRISNRMKSLIGARNVANALLGGPDETIVVPQVVKNRETPPELTGPNEQGN